MASAIYDFQLAANVGATRLIQAIGNRFKLLRAPGGSVIVRTDRGDVYQLLEGQGFTLPDGSQFREIYLSNPRAVSNFGEVFVGDQTFDDDRVTGSVNVIDSSKDKVLLGVTFVACMSRGGGAFPTRVQLQNPAGSNKELFITAVTVGLSVSEPIGVTRTTTMFAKNNGDTPAPMDPDGVASAALIRYDDENAVVAGLQNFRLGYGQANGDRVIVFPNPLRLPPGHGAYVVAASAANVLRISFEYEEWPL